MTRPEFERELARLRERIAGLPEAQRAELERLAVETLERHEQIARSSLAAQRAAERLELGHQQLREACDRIAALAERARDTLERVRTQGVRPAPGLN